MEKARIYIQETVNELLYKVSWPSWEELQSSAVIVLVASIISALLIFFMDFIFGANAENQLFQGILHYVYQLFK